MWYLSHIHLIALLSYLSLAAYILTRRPLARLHLSLASVIICLAIWTIEQLSFTFPEMPKELLPTFNLVGALGWIGLSPTFMWFVLTLTGRDNKPGYLRLLLAVTIVAIVLWVAQTQRLIINDYFRIPYGWNTQFANNAWSLAFIIYYALVILSSQLILLGYIRKPGETRLKRHARLLFLFTWIGFGLGSATDVLAPFVRAYNVPPLGNIMCLVWAIALGYTIARHRFLTLSPATAAENIISTMSDLLILTDTKGRIVRVNRAVEECLGWHQTYLAGRSMEDLLVREAGSNGEKQSDAIVASGVENQRTALLTRDGRKVPAILSSSPIMDSEQPAGYVTLIKDISRIEYAEAALKKSEARFRELVETINEVVFSLDHLGNFTYLSPAFKHLTGYPSEAAIGQHLTDFVYEEDIEDQKQQLNKLFNGRVNISRYRLKHGSGGYCWVQASSKPITTNGQVTGANGILTDISEQVTAQKEKEMLMARLAKAEKMEAIGTLAGAVAHDLNNVLSGVVSYPELMLLDLPRGSRLRKMTKTIMKSGIKAAAIVEDLLTLARRGVIATEIVDLNQIVREYLASPEYEKLKAAAPNVLITADLEDRIDSISGSPVHLSKAVMNLMTNAFEALPEEGGRITIKTRNGLLPFGAGQNESDRCVVLSIRDTGLGIATEDQERIFEPFFTRKIMGRSGTGLGMAVVWGAVKDHNGYIDLESQPGKGTEFVLRFPSIRENKAPTEDSETLTPFLGNQEAILLVDDDEDQRDIASDILMRLGYRVHTADSGKAAIDFLKQQPADLVILDMIMPPGMDGLDTFRQITSVCPGQKVILASGYSQHTRIKTALENGVLGFLKKPYLMKEIGETVRSALYNPQ